MCGIFGYIGHKPAQSLLMRGLLDLKYRGYDSAGLAILEGDRLKVLKVAEDPVHLQPLITKNPSSGTVGIAHNRWATHGGVTEANAHPHVSNGTVTVVHNGTIENYRELRTELQRGGYEFMSETDTEVLPHLIHREIARGKKSLAEAVAGALLFVEGTYAIAVISSDFPDTLVGACRSSTLTIGLDSGRELFLASDEVALARHVRHIIQMKDGDLVTLRRDGLFDFLNLPPEDQKRPVENVSITPEQVSLGRFAHHMHKEILEQPTALRETLRGQLQSKEKRVTLGCFREKEVIEHAKTCPRIIISAAGTSYYSGLAGKQIIERLTNIPVEVLLSSEFRPVMNGGELCIFISQSGTTADTLNAMRKAQSRDGFCLGITNRVASRLAKEAERGVYLHVGPEQAVASTKAFTAQVVALTLIGASVAQARGIRHERFEPLLEGLEALPKALERVLLREAQIKELAREYKNAKRIFCIARDFAEPLAYEGALKLAEIPYFDAQGLAGGEIKHGKLALVEAGIPVIAVVRKNSIRDKMLSNMEEVKSRGGDLIAITTEGDCSAHPVAKHVIELPDLAEELDSVIAAPVFQLLSYYLGLERGSNVDQPRNLAKSVTVE